MQELRMLEKEIERGKLKKLGYSMLVKGFIVVLEPKNLTEQTSGLVQFRRQVDVDKEIGEMIESRVF